MEKLGKKQTSTLNEGAGLNPEKETPEQTAPEAPEAPAPETPEQTAPEVPEAPAPDAPNANEEAEEKPVSFEFVAAKFKLDGVVYDSKELTEKLQGDTPDAEALAVVKKLIEMKAGVIKIIE